MVGVVSLVVWIFGLFKGLRSGGPRIWSFIIGWGNKVEIHYHEPAEKPTGPHGDFPPRGGKSTADHQAPGLP